MFRLTSYSPDPGKYPVGPVVRGEEFDVTFSHWVSSSQGHGDCVCARLDGGDHPVNGVIEHMRHQDGGTGGVVHVNNVEEFLC